MKKITLVSLISILFLSLSSIVAYLLRYISLDSPWLYIVLGVLILFGSGVLAFLLKKYKFSNILCLLLSSIALGFLIRSWYIFREFDNPLWMMLLVSFSCAIYLWIFYLLLYIPFFEKHYGVFTIIFLVLSFLGYLLVIGFTETTFVSTFGFYMIVEIAFIIGLCMKSKTYSQLMRNMVLCSYSIFIVAIIIVILMLAGDGADFDFSFDIGGEPNGLSSPKDKKVINDLENRI